MHILNVIQCTNLGGMEQSALTLLTELRARGHEVEMLSLNPIGGLGPLLRQHGIPVHGLPYRGRGGWRSLPQFKRELNARKSEALIMTGHNLLAMLALGNLGSNQRLLMIHFHHKGVKPRWQWRLIYQVALRQFSAIGFASDFIRREAELICPAISKVSHTIGNPIVLNRPPTAAQRMQARFELGIPLESCVVGNAGWLIPRKRFDVFLQVARNIAMVEPKALFLIAGDGPERERLELLAQALGIADRVRWLGWKGDLTSFYRSLDLAVFNTDWDALGLTPLEALSAGVPIVASVLNGGLTEILDDRYGLVFRSHDIAQLAQTSLNVLGDRAKAEHLVCVARRRIGEVASVEKYVARVCRLLRIPDNTICRARTVQ